MTTTVKTIKATGKGTTIPCRDLAAFFVEVAKVDPFAKIRISLGWRGQIRMVTAEFPLGGGRDEQSETSS